MNQHSGKKLSDVPFEEIEVGMKVRSNIDGEGQITTVLPNADSSLSRVKIDYDNGAAEIARPFRFVHVKVK